MTTSAPPRGAAPPIDTSPRTETRFRAQEHGYSGVDGTPATQFNTIYLAEPAAACAGELERLAQSQGLTVADLIAASRTLHTVAVQKLPVLDLRDDAARQKVGLDLADIADDDLTACQSVGQAAHFLNFGGILAPSATGIGLVLAAFESRLRPGQLTALTAQPFTQELYTQIASGN